MRETYLISQTSCGSFQFISPPEVDKSILTEARLRAKINPNGTMEIVNPIESHRSYFVAKSGGNIVLSNDASSVIKDPRENIDQFFLIKNLAQDEEYGFETIWKHIKNLPPGATLYASCNGSGNLDFEITDQLGQQITPNSDDPMGILVDEIHRKAELLSTNKIIVQFSGGRDSLGLLVAAKSIPQAQVSAITWTYDRGSAHEDLISSQSYTKMMGVEQIVLDICPSEILKPPELSDLTPNVSISTAFLQFKKRLDRRILADFGGSALVLDGHGGDHLYFDPVPWAVVTDARKQSLLKGFQAAKTVSGLFGMSPYRMWRNQAWAKKFRRRNAVSFLSPDAVEMLQEKKKQEQSGKENHHELIRLAIQQNSICTPSLNSYYFTPFTSARILGSVWELPVSRFYDSQRTRIPFEDSFYKFAAKIKLRRNKGHITGAHQHAIRLKKNDLTDLLANGYLQQKRLLNVEGAISGLSKAALGYGGVSEFLLKIICFELMMISA